MDGGVCGIVSGEAAANASMRQEEGVTRTDGGVRVFLDAGIETEMDGVPLDVAVGVDVDEDIV